MPYRLPLKFIGLWAANLVLILAVIFATGFQKTLLRIGIKNAATVCLAAAAILALLEQSLWDKLRGE